MNMVNMMMNWWNESKSLKKQLRKIYIIILRSSVLVTLTKVKNVNKKTQKTRVVLTVSRQTDETEVTSLVTNMTLLTAGMWSQI